MALLVVLQVGHAVRGAPRVVGAGVEVRGTLGLEEALAPGARHNRHVAGRYDVRTDGVPTSSAIQIPANNNDERNISIIMYKFISLLNA